MKKFLGMEYPVALFMIGSNRTSLTQEILGSYCEYLNARIEENNDDCIILYSTYYLEEMAYKFSNMFKLIGEEIRYIVDDTDGNGKFDALRKRILAYLPTKTYVNLKTYSDEILQKYCTDTINVKNDQNGNEVTKRCELC